MTRKAKNRGKALNSWFVCLVFFLFVSYFGMLTRGLSPSRFEWFEGREGDIHEGGGSFLFL